MSKVTRKFSDLDFDFLPHPVSRDIVPLVDAASVKRALRNLMFTGTYERLFQPNLGANLKQLLFEPISPMTALSVKLLIQDVIRYYEPRVSVVELQVNVSEDENGYNVYLIFAIDNISDVIAVDFFLERLR